MYQRRAREQQVVRPRLSARRGKILDRNGNVFAMSTMRPAIWADPSLVPDARVAADILAIYLERDHNDLMAKLAAPRRRFVWLAKVITDKQATLVRQGLRNPALRGVYLDERPHRVYPKGALLGNVIGLCNDKGDGAEGLELQANDLLRGMDGYLMAKRDNRRRVFLDPLWVGGKTLEPVDGNDVYLTIDEYIQHVTDRALYGAVTQYGPTRAVAIVMAPATGHILALAQWPSFDPNMRTNYIPGITKCFAATEIFEPGSTMKAISGAIALNENAVALDTPIYCENGAWEHFRGFVLHDDHPIGEVPFRDVIRYSSNIGIAKSLRPVDRSTYYNYLLRFGFGRRTEIALFPSESPGLLRAPAQWSELSKVSLPMGQEIGVTALQLLSAMATIANGGTRVRPTIVKRVQTAQGALALQAGQFNYFEPVVLERNVISTATVAAITEALITVTADDGTGALADIPGYSVAGKTGTAQKYGTRGYSRDVMASFVGFVPARNPALCALVLLDTPRMLRYGDLVTAPVFRSVCSEALAYLKIAKDKPEPVSVHLAQARETR